MDKREEKKQCLKEGGILKQFKKGRNEPKLVKCVNGEIKMINMRNRKNEDTLNN